MSIIKKYQNIIFIVFIATFPIIDIFLNKGIFFAHDIEQNIARFGAFYKSLLEGNLVPRWADGIANGYGGPILIFSYSIPYYIASVFRFWGFSLIDSMKLLMAFTFIGSSLMMYLWMKKHVSGLPALIGAILYIYAPYRFSDIYARGSIPEQTAFFFIPIVLLAIKRLFEKITINKMLFLSFAFAALILSHPFFMVIFSFLFIPYIIYNWWVDKNNKAVFCVILSFIIALGLTAYFLIPVQIETKYTHYDISPFNGTTFYTQYNTFSKLFMPVWSFTGGFGTTEYITYQVGIVHWFIFLSSLPLLYLLWKKKSKLFSFLIFGIIGFLLSLFFMLPPSRPVYQLLRPLQQIQFPWRFLSLSITSVPIILIAIMECYKKAAKLIAVAVIAGILILYLPYAKGHGFTQRTDHYYLDEFETNTEGPGTQPRWAAAPEHYQRPSQRIMIIEGKGTISNELFKTTKHAFTLTALSNIRIADNTFYFPGWSVYIDGKLTEIQYQDPDYRGIITFNVPMGQHDIEVKFGDTKIRKFADYISIGFLIMSFFALIISRKKKA